MRELAGRVAVVTGGASGIGMGIAKQLLAEGMRVVIADVEREACERTAAETGAVGIPTDVSDLDSVRALAREATERFGTVHVVCNNAGVGPIGRIADLTIEDWRWMIDVNLYGVIHGVQTFLPILEANSDGGHIVNTASMLGLVSFANFATYSVTKFGVVALTEALAAELKQDGSKVGATVLCPGSVRTNIRHSSRNRPAHLAGALADVDVAERSGDAGYRWLAPEEAGAVVVAAIKRGDLYALTHPELFEWVELRHQTLAEAFQKAAESNPA
jgi:NAD(P)-dependent dehydrogenase (short-subunit alcohol dehydrogenase family)